MPSALGARDFLDVKASTTKVMIYGSIRYTWELMPIYANQYTPSPLMSRLE